jgi:hypothetical protein
MRTRRAPKPSALLAALALMTLFGCRGSDLTRVTGQVIEDGQPRQLSPGESIQIDFATADNAYPPLALGVFVRRDGTFVADMNDGTGAGLRPGKYKVKLNRESTSVKKVNARLFKESYTLDAALGTPIRLTIDLTAGTISQ